MKSMMKYIFVAKVSMQEALAYSMNFLGRGVFYIIIISIMVFLWKAIYAQGVDTGDYDVNRMIWYLIIGELIALSGARFYEEVSNDVKTGNIAYLMNKPYHYVNYQFAHYIGKTVIQLLVNCIIAIPLGLIYVGSLDGFSFKYLPFIIVTILMGLCLDFMVNMALALSAFWVEENEPFRWIYQKLVFTLGGMLIPLELFPEKLYQISRFLPFAFVTYVPAKLTTDFNMTEFLQLAGIQFGYIILMMLITMFIYQRGVKKLNVNGG